MMKFFTFAVVVLTIIAYNGGADAQACPCTCQATVTIPGVANFPAGILDQLNALTGYNALQVTNILGMIQGPEQGRTEWWIDADGDTIYGYAEDIGDGRGVTFGLYGATTGSGYNDADIIWGYYGKNLGTGSVSQIVAAIKAVENDAAWHAAMWKGYINTYWTDTKTVLAATGLPYSALTFGAVLDTCMNAGTEDDSSSSWGCSHVASEAKKTTTTDVAFLTRFLQLRAQYPTERSGEMTQRIAAWQKLLTAKQFNMNSATLLKGNYAYIPAGWAVNITIIDDGVGLRSHSLQMDDGSELVSVRGVGQTAGTTLSLAALFTAAVVALISPVVMMWG